jgi:hypothetical protein
VLALVSLVATDVAYQIVKKPTELWAVVPSSGKTPRTTWETYGPLFEEHSTPFVRPALLAALVQAESAGDPLARTYWRWRWGWNPIDLWAPASSAVGILQITDGTFAEARRFCIHDHAVAREGAWSDLDACWFNGLYFRTVPSHAIEMTSARLHQVIVEILADLRLPAATPAERERLGAVIHLCGRARGVAYASRRFRGVPGERCGDHDLLHYLARVEALKTAFAQLGEPG